jgi:hypothetical protein
MTAAIADNETAMAKRKPPKKAQPSEERGGQIRFMVYLDPAVMDAIDAFRSSQEMRPSKTTIAHLAFTEFLTNRGFRPK